MARLRGTINDRRAIQRQQAQIASTIVAGASASAAASEAIEAASGGVSERFQEVEQRLEALENPEV